MNFFSFHLVILADPKSRSSFLHQNGEHVFWKTQISPSNYILPIIQDSLFGFFYSALLEEAVICYSLSSIRNTHRLL